MCLLSWNHWRKWSLSTANSLSPVYVVASPGPLPLFAEGLLDATTFCFRAKKKTPLQRRESKVNQSKKILRLSVLGSDRGDIVRLRIGDRKIALNFEGTNDLLHAIGKLFILLRNLAIRFG